MNPLSIYIRYLYSFIFMFSLLIIGADFSFAGPPIRAATGPAKLEPIAYAVKSGARSAVTAGENAFGGVGDFLSGMVGCDPAEAAQAAEEKVAKMNPVNFDEINKSVAAIGIDIVNECKANSAIVSPCEIPNFPELEKSRILFQNNYENCHTAQNKAASICLECNNSSLAGTLGMANTIMAGAGAMGVSDQCSKVGKAMTIASAGLSAYSAACGLVKAGCGMTCGRATKGLSGMKNASESLTLLCTPTPGPTVKAGIAKCSELTSKLNGNKTQLVAAINKELAVGTLGTVAGKGERCAREYGKLAISALAGAAQLVNSAKQAEQCKKETEATAQAAADAPLDCKDAKNASMPECICELNPRNPGCSNGLSKSASGFDSPFDGRLPTSESSPDTTIGDIKPIDTGGGLGIDGKPSAGASGAAAAGGGSGGSFGGGGGSDGSAAAAGAGGEQYPAGYSMDASGGGGGGGWNSGTGSEENLEKFLPGGKEDPNAMAGNEFPSDVTTESGKSNWDKVRDRYSDNKRSLMGN